MAETGGSTNSSHGVGVPRGESIYSRGGLLAMSRQSHDLHKSAVDEYFRHWDDEDGYTEDSRAARRKNYATISKSYYDTVTDILEMVQSESFHFYSLKNGESMREALRRHEHELADYAGIDETHFVLDVGCGVGGPAREIARRTGARILGLNINDYQLARAHRYNQEQGLGDKVEFVKGDFMKMPFDSGTFDRAYSIEATSYAPSLEGAYSEIFRVLKPGGKFAAYELIMTNNYDEDNPEHAKIHHELEKGRVSRTL